MLVEYVGKVRLVYGLRFSSDGRTSCIIREYDEDVAENYENAEEFRDFYEIFKILDINAVKIINPDLPPNWTFTPCSESWLSCCCFPRGFEREAGDADDFDELLWGYLDYERTLIANEMLAFHGLPPIEIPPEFVPAPEITDEDRRLKRIERELNGYLEYADK